MGIPGLLKELNSFIGRDAHVSIYRGKAVAVDASGWLHRSTYSCALELILGLPTTAYLSLLRAFVLLLLDHDITPIIVFDGDHLPAKAATNAAREQHRLKHQELALQYHKQGNTELATFHAQQAVQITPAIIAAFLDLCRSMSVAVIVAPFEADAQMSYLARHGHVCACITEDSDLIPFGVDRLFIRLTRDGSGREIAVSDLPLLQTPSDPFVRRMKALYMSGGLLGVCVLSGCDYLCSLKGMGLRTAVRWWDQWKCIEMIVGRLKRHRSTGRKKRKRGSGTAHSTAAARSRDDSDIIVIDVEAEDEAQDEEIEEIDVEAEEDDNKLGSDDEGAVNRGKGGLYDSYALDFHKAVLTFQHQLVYDHIAQVYAYLTPLPPALQHLSTLAAASSPTTASSSSSPSAASAAVSITDSSLSLSSRLDLSHRHNSAITSLDFLGTPPPAHLAVQLTSGLLNPKTLRPYVAETPAIHSFFARRSDEQEAAGRRRLEDDKATLEQELQRVDADTDFDAQPTAHSQSLSRANTAPLRNGGAKASAWKTRTELLRERRMQEEQRSTGGGLLRFFQKQ